MKHLRLLIIEDVEDHALLIVRELQKGGLPCDFQRVESVEELKAALEAGPWDAVISDFNLPEFDGIDALRIVQEKGLDLPFLLVSGAIGEEKAAEVMKAGAHDYIRKGNYARLVPTLERELRDAKVRHERRLTAEELTKHREHLEELVQERTEELIKANEALQGEIAERRQAEEARQESESRYRTLFESIDEGYCIIEMIFEENGDPVDYRFLETNPSFEKQTGLVNAKGKTMRELAPEHEEYWFEIYGRTAVTGEPARFEAQAEQLRRWFDVYAFRFGRSEQRQVAVLFYDITERKESEEQLRKSEAKFIKIFNAAPALIGIISIPEETVIDINETALHALGYRREEVIGRTAQELGVWGDQSEREKVMQHLEKQESIRDLEIRLNGKSGESLVGLLSSEIIELDQQTYMLGLVRDITERKRAEEALVRAKQEWERTFDSVPDLIAIIDEEERIVRVNRAMAERLGRQPDECVGLLCYSAIHGTASEPDYCPHTKTVADKGNHEAVVLEHHLGGQFMVTTTALAVYGTTKGTVYVARDLSERMRAEQEITRLNADLSARVSELEERNQELEAFNRMISHDLRQPLNTIGMACQSMGVFCGDQDENCRESIKIAYKGVGRMNTMIETLLNFSRSSHGDLQREVFDLGKVAKDVINELRSAEPDRRVEFKLADGIMANADPKLLRTVLENLIGNAWKYTGNREQGIIEVGAMDVDGNETYLVRDNGKGFDIADADKLFIPFQRLPESEAFKGSGIGLATVERIIKKHGGRIWAEGEPGKGATFYFTLGASITGS